MLFENASVFLKKAEKTLVKEALRKKTLHFSKNVLYCKRPKENTVCFVGGQRVPKKREVRLMAYKISDACISCGACTDACPVSAIAEGDGTYVIDADTCIDCGACADACPVSAPEAE